MRGRGLLLLTAALVVGRAAGLAHAADVFVEPLGSTGLSTDAQPSFQTAIDRAFEKAGHKLVKPELAAFRARTSVVKDRSRYQLTVKVLDGLGKQVIDKTAECAPCTLDQAEKQLELLVRTVSLDLDALADAPLPAAPPAAPTLVTPSPIVPPPSSCSSNRGRHRCSMNSRAGTAP